MDKLHAKLAKFWDYGSGRMLMASICAHSLSISIGICQGYSAILIPQLTASEEYNITMEESSWLAGLGAITNPLGSILSGFFAEYFGRKLAIQMTAVPFFIGWLCIGLANKIEWIYVGRLVTGIASGMASLSYTYVSEISTPENRGILLALGPISASLGILLTYISGYLLPWNYAAIINITFAIFTAIAMNFLPESPAYLLSRNRATESFDVYLFFYRSNAKAHEQVYNHAHRNTEKHEREATFSERYMCPETVKPFLILIALFFLQEASGIYVVLFYTVNFIEAAATDVDDFLASIVVGCIRFMMSIATAYLILKCDRRTLCSVSSLGMFATILPLALYLKFYEGMEKSFTFIPLLCIALNVCFSMIGMLPLPYVLVGEYFSLKARSIMSGFVVCIAQCFIFLSVKIYPYMVMYMTFSGTLFTFAFASAISVVFCRFFVPETRNKTLEEIEENFRQQPKKKVDTRCLDDELSCDGVYTIKMWR